jgi:hypothetical protein
LLLASLLIIPSRYLTKEADLDSDEWPTYFEFKLGVA